MCRVVRLVVYADLVGAWREEEVVIVISVKLFFGRLVLCKFGL